MNHTEKTEDETKAAGEDWAVLPFDEREDEERWDKLIADTDDLAERAAAVESAFGETTIEESLPGGAAANNSPKTEDEELAEMNPF